MKLQVYLVRMRRTGRAFGRKGPVREGKPYRERPAHIPLSEDLGKDILQDAARQIVFFFNRRINADDDTQGDLGRQAL